MPEIVSINVIDLVLTLMSFENSKTPSRIMEKFSILQLKNYKNVMLKPNLKVYSNLKPTNPILG